MLRLEYSRPIGYVVELVAVLHFSLESAHAELFESSETCPKCQADFASADFVPVRSAQEFSFMKILTPKIE